MKPNLPDNPASAYKEGWRDGLVEAIYRIDKMRDKYLMPENSKEQRRLIELTTFKTIVEPCLDITTALAEMQDRKQLNK